MAKCKHKYTAGVTNKKGGIIKCKDCGEILYAKSVGAVSATIDKTNQRNAT